MRWITALAMASALVVPVMTQSPSATRAFVGATLFDGSGAAAIPNAVLVVRGGQIIAAGPANSVRIPEGAERVDVSGRFIIPGLVNAHGHIGSADGLQAGAAVNTDDNVRRQLALNARYGVTTVVSLGDDAEPGFRAREGNNASDLDRARIFVAGPVVNAQTPEQARQRVREIAKLQPDWIKIRVDDNLGSGTRMAPEVYRAVIDLMKARDVCLSPTLMREVSTFVYATRPAFFDDPFFTREADPKVVAALESPERQAAMAKSRAAEAYRKGLEVARGNVKAVHEAGIRIASGTDSGPPARFQGYFEHLELEELVRSGLSAAQALKAATGDAAGCTGIADRVGTLTAGRAADFLVLSRDPLQDIRNTRAIESVWIAGNRVNR